MRVIKTMVMPRNIIRKSKDSDIDDAILNSEYDEKFKIEREKEKICTMLRAIQLFIYERYPKIEHHGVIFTGCHDLLEKIKKNWENQHGDNMKCKYYKICELMRLSSFSCTKDGGGNCGKFRNFPSKKSAKRELALQF